MKPTSALRTLAAISISALMASAAAVVPASAATVAPLNYTCDAPFGPYTFKVSADTTLPESAPPGAALTGSATYTVVIPDSLRGLMYGTLNGRFVEGTASIKSTTFGAATTLSGAVPKTPIPSSGELTVVASSAVATTAPAAPGAYQIVAGDFSTAIKVTREDGTTATETTVTCALNPGQNAVVDTVTVDPAAPTPTPTAAQETTTKVKASYAKKTKKIVATVKVGSDDKAATGKAKVLVKLGKKTVKKLTVTVKGGKAKAVVKNVTKPGTYKVTVSYAGDDTHEKSKGKATVKVS